jgi:8-oxo-dGTP pyrophosphatase MutT (NUDIX family)
VDELTAAIAAHRPWRIPLGKRLRTAAVAAVLRAGRDGPELLLIRRPKRDGDRWSGNVAFPGGLAQSEDDGPVETARREAREEVGLELGAPIGALSELITAQPGRARPMRVVPYVFVAEPDVVVVSAPAEVAVAEWLPLTELIAASPQRITKRIGPVHAKVRAMELSVGTLWGLTFSMVRELTRIAPG